MLKRLSTRAVTLLVALTALGACVDAKKRFDEFDDRVPVIDASTVDRPTVPISNIDGTWYLAIKSLGSNLHLFVTWDITITGTTATLDGTYQPLSASQDPQVPPPRMSVGMALTNQDGMVDDTATFTAPISGTFDAMANPISGSKLGSKVSLVGTIKSADSVCGTLIGVVCLGGDVGPGGACTDGASEVPVSPATFAAVRVNSIAEIQAMPLPPTDRCPAPAQ